jgi:hypothetical protein
VALAGGLVGEDSGPSVSPAEDVGAQQTGVAVVGGPHGSPPEQGLFEHGPGGGTVRGHVVAAPEPKTRTASVALRVGWGQWRCSERLTA